MKANELEHLLERLCDAELDAVGFARIEELVGESAEARQYYIEWSQIHGDLSWSNSRTASAKVVPTVTALHGRSAISRLTGRNAARGYAVAAMVCLSVTAGLFWWGSRNNSAQASVALITEEIDCEWREGDLLGVGASVKEGELIELKRGVARLTFASAATVLLEGPAQVVPLSDVGLRLVSGSVAVRAEGVDDFLVESPDASVLDLGTSFAVYCGPDRPTEVEVFEGKVEVLPGSDKARKKVLEMGESLSVKKRGPEIYDVSTGSQYEGRFSKLLETLWKDIRTDSASEDPVYKCDHVEASFSDDPASGAVDVFYRSKPGSGWVTPWVAAGNPVGKILSGDTAFGPDNPLLQLRFRDSTARAIGREYGQNGAFDPSRPHVLSWKWRLDGDPADFTESFLDRVAFYGNPCFRCSSWPSNSWLIGVVGGNETKADPTYRHPGSSTSWLIEHRGLGAEAPDYRPNTRGVFPGNWYFFNSLAADGEGGMLQQDNMIDTGMPLQFDVVYRFAVIVYPQRRQYDAAICDGAHTVIQRGMWFRNREAVSANVFHAAIHSGSPEDSRGMSIDSLFIGQVDIDSSEPLRTALENHP